MEREQLEPAIRRYNTILRFITDDRTVAAVMEMLAETRERLSKIDQIASARAGTQDATGDRYRRRR